MNSDENKSKNDCNSRPVTPSEESCCGNGCNPCIIDVHKMLLDQWEKRKKENIEEKRRQNLLSPISYKPFTINDIYEICEDYVFLCLEYKGETKVEEKLYFNPGQYIIIHSWSMSKPYTPISWTERNFLLLIKIHPNGNFSTRLKHLKIDDTLDVRGPYGDFTYKSNSFKKIIMFSIGSGIAAVYPIAKSIIDNEEEDTRISFIAGFRSLLHVPLKKELQYLSSYWNFICTLYISQITNADNVINFHGVTVKRGHIDNEAVVNLLHCDKPETTLILICGTPQFNTSIEKWTRELKYYYIHIFK